MTYAIKTGEKKVATTFEYSYFDIGNYIAYKSVSMSTNETRERVVQGITLSVSAFKRGKNPEDARYGYVSDEKLDGMRKQGYGYDMFSSSKEKPAPGIYDYLVAGGDAANIIRVDGWHMLYDLNDEIVPTGMHFDYSDAHIDNAHYDLKQVADILRRRSDITFVENSGFPEVMDAPEIQRIPGYNASRERSQYLPFFWLPSKEIAAHLAADPSNRYKVVFDEDLLGLRAAAMFDNFYKSVPETYDEDDCRC